MSDPHLGYWKEAIECALDAEGLFGVIPDDKLTRIAESLVISARQQSMAFGWDAISNPKEEEIKRLSEIIDKERNETANKIRAMIEDVAKSQHVEPHNVSFKDGKFWIRESR